MPVKSLMVVAVLVVLAFGAPAAFAGTNLVNNGGFETGDFTGWTTGGNFEFTQVVSGPFYVYPGAQEGTFYATLGPTSADGGDGTLSQTLSTVNGAQYTFSFWLAAVGDSPSDFSASWDGTTLYSATDPDTGGAWTQFSFNVTGTGSDTLSFSFDDDPAYIALDNVSVMQNTGTTPEPSSIMLLGSGVIALGGAIRRKMRG